MQAENILIDENGNMGQGVARLELGGALAHVPSNDKAVVVP
jgi:hypothetical protein